MELGSIIVIGICGIIIGAVIIILYNKYQQKVKAIEVTQKQQTELEEQKKLISDIRKNVTNFILNDDIKTFDAIAKQKVILNDRNRDAIAIFLSTKQFKKILTSMLMDTPQNTVDNLCNTLIKLNVPVGFIGDLPLYVSELLTDAPVFVVGSIHWDFNG